MIHQSVRKVYVHGQWVAVSEDIYKAYYRKVVRLCTPN